MNRRRYERIRFPEDAVTLCGEQSCHFRDISGGGLSVIYDGRHHLPDVMSVSMSLPDTDVSLAGVECIKVWETSMPFVTIHGRTVIKKRGVRFSDPEDPSVQKLLKSVEMESEGAS